LLEKASDGHKPSWSEAPVTKAPGRRFSQLRRLRLMRAGLGRDVTLTLVTSLVLSRLDYCNSVLAGHPASILAPLQRDLHAAARLVNGLRPHDHVSPTLKELHWLPIKQRVDYKLCLLVHKVVVGYAPSYLTDILTAVTDVPSQSTLRAASNGDYVVPRTRLKFNSVRGRSPSLLLKHGIGCQQNSS